MLRRDYFTTTDKKGIRPNAPRGAKQQISPNGGNREPRAKDWRHKNQK